MFAFLPLVIISGYATQAYAICQSYGTDFVDGGSYCIDPRSTDVFSFGTSWLGCDASSSQGGIDPYLSDPNGDGRYCSTIQTNPDGQSFLSTCNVDGPSLTKNQMTTGNWTVGLYGLTFAYQREFYLKMQVPVTVTSTPTVSFTMTTTPVQTTTSTTTGTDTITLKAVTTTIPSITITHTSTITPARVTTTTTSTNTITKTTWSFIKVTATSTWTCPGVNPRQDPKATWTPTRVASALASASIAGSFNVFPFKRGRVEAGWGINRIWPRAEAPAVNLAKRTPDLCTTTTLGTSAVSTTITSTAPVSTVVITTAATTTVTITPAPVITYSGKAMTTIAVTLATPTRTITKYTTTQTTTTKTISATVTAKITVAPRGAVCKWLGQV